jgi:phosphoserine phosphatase RsbU/P
MIGIEENIKKISISELKYMTITICKFDKQGKFIYAGQHQDILVYRKNDNIVESFPTEGLWIGLGYMAEDKSSFIKDYTFQLNNGDSLLVYTDGLIEGQDKNGKYLGLNGLKKIFEQNGSFSVEHIKQSILKILQNYQINDDISFLVMKKEDT